MKINYSLKGKSDKTIILMHGWGGSSESLLGLQLKLVELGYKVYNLDLPGFGKSEKPINALTQVNYVDLVKEFIEENSISKPALVGHSFGGKISLGLGLKYPEKISKVVLINSSGIKPKNSLKRTLFLFPTKLLGVVFSLPVLNKLKPTVRSLFYRGVVREQDYLKASKVMRESMKNVLSVNYDQSLVNFKLPTLLIWGEKDTYTPLWHGQKMHRLISDSRLEVVANATHNLPLKQPDVVAMFISEFI